MSDSSASLVLNAMLEEFGDNAPFALELYAQYRLEPASVGENWKQAVQEIEERVPHPMTGRILPPPPLVPQLPPSPPATIKVKNLTQPRQALEERVPHAMTARILRPLELVPELPPASAAPAP